MTTQATRRIPDLELFEKPKRTMKQPTKQALRNHVKDLQDLARRQAEELEHLRNPWWKRLMQPHSCDAH